MQYSLFARFEGNYSMTAGSSLEDYLNGKTVAVYEVYGSESKRTSMTYQKGAVMSLSSLKGTTILFTISAVLAASGAGVQTFYVSMSEGTQTTESQITLSSPSLTKVSVPEIYFSNVNYDLHAWFYVPSHATSAILMTGGETISEMEFDSSEYGSEKTVEIGYFFVGKPAGDYPLALVITGVESGYVADNVSHQQNAPTVHVYDTLYPNAYVSNGVAHWANSDYFSHLEIDDGVNDYEYFEDKTGTAGSMGTGIPSEVSIDSSSTEITLDFWPAVWTEKETVEAWMSTDGWEDPLTETLSLVAPDAPTLQTISPLNMLMSWTNLTDGATYNIYRDGVCVASTTEASYQLNETEIGVHSYWVTAFKNDKESAASTRRSVTVRKLAAPECVYYELNGKTYIKNANTYSLAVGKQLFINGSATTLPTNSSVSVDVTSSLKTGLNTFKCKVATTLTSAYLESDESEVQISVSGEGWVAEINGVQYGVQYPLSITQTIDETLDVGSVILDIQDTKDIKKPFQAFTPVRLVSFTEDGTKRLEMAFIVESDAVTEKQMGDEIWSLHELTIIEETRKLQNVLMPDLAITQPLSLASQLGDEAIGDSYGLSNVFAKYLIEDREPSAMNFTSWYWAVFQAGVFEVISNLRSQMPVGFVSDLPDLNCDGVSICLLAEDYLMLKPHYTKYLIRTESPTKWVFIRKRANGETKWSRAEALSYINGDRSVFCSVQKTREKYGSLQYTFDDVADYDVYLWVAPVGDYRITEGEPSFTSWNKRLQEIARKGNCEGYEYPNVVGLTSDGAKPTDEDEFLYCFTTTTKTSASASEGEYSVASALDKIIAAVKPLEQSYGTSRNLPYSVQCTHGSDTCYEGEWSGGRTLYEILSAVGSQFRGIPRLTGSTISFDIIGETRNGNPLWQEETTLAKESSDMDTQATALVSQAKNVISDDVWETYPSETGWVTCRSSNAEDAYCTRANSVIKLPRKIYQIKSIYVKDTKTGRTYSIFQDHCLESTLWNLLIDNQEGKGCCLKFTRGDDKIENIGALVDEDTYELWGLQPDEYVIQNILSSITLESITSFDPQYLAYRVVYRPYTDQVVKCEQANGSEGVASELAYNQNETVATASRLGLVMQDKVSRLGNNVVSMMCRTPLDTAPQIGQAIERNGSTYYLTKVNYTIERDYVESTMEFSKDKNNIDVSVGLASEYRQYEIYADDYVTRQLSLDRYAVASTEEGDKETGFDDLKSALYAALQNKQAKRPADFYITACKAINTPLTYTDFEGVTQTCKAFALHADFHSIGTSCVFNAKAEDNYSMGVCAYQLETAVQSRNSGKYVQKDCRYVDDYGKAKYFGVCLGGISKPALLDIGVGADSARTLPYAKYTFNPASYFSTIYENSFYEVQKDNREAMAFQWSLHFVSDSQELEVRPGFAANLFKKEGVSQACKCYKVSGVIAEALTTRQMSEEISFTLTETGAGVKVETAEENWVLAFADTKMRPAIISKGSKVAYINLTKTWKGE